MKLFGLEITRTKAAQNLLAVGDRGNWWQTIVREPFTGAWQRNMEVRRDTAVSYSAVYACVTLIAADIGKLRIRLVEEDKNGIWSETSSSAFSPVLRRPNRYQNRISFFESWVVSKLLNGNTYILKERDSRGVVVALYILDPERTKVKTSPDGSIYYELRSDNLSGIGDTITVPARDIIHDRLVSLNHPLCGSSPLGACGLAAMQGLNIQNNSANFFANGSRPSGILSAPGNINEADAVRLKTHWEQNYSGVNAGKVAVVGSGLKYESLTMTALDAQLIEQLKWTAETVCSAFHVPAYMIGVGPPPAYTNIQALNQQYYTQCLQGLIEAIELCLDEGLGLVDVQGVSYGTEFDLDALLRMDTATQYKAISDGINGGFLAPNEGRKKIDLPPVAGGDTPYLQQQNFSLAALDKRDSAEDPFATAKPAAQEALPAPEKSEDGLDEQAMTQLAAWQLKSLLDGLPVAA